MFTNILEGRTVIDHENISRIKTGRREEHKGPTTQQHETIEVWDAIVMGLVLWEGEGSVWAMRLTVKGQQH